MLSSVLTDVLQMLPSAVNTSQKNQKISVHVCRKLYITPLSAKSSNNFHYEHVVLSCPHHLQVPSHPIYIHRTANGLHRSPPPVQNFWPKTAYEPLR